MCYNNIMDEQISNKATPDDNRSQHPQINLENGSLDEKKQSEYNKRLYSRISLICSLVPIILLLFCIEQALIGSKGIGYLIFFYAITFWLPLKIACITYAIKGLKTVARGMAVVSLVLSAMPIFLLIVLAIVE